MTTCTMELIMAWNEPIPPVRQVYISINQSSAVMIDWAPSSPAGPKTLPWLAGANPTLPTAGHPATFHLTWSKLGSPPPAPRQNRVVEEVQECDLFILLPQDKDDLQQEPSASGTSAPSSSQSRLHHAFSAAPSPQLTATTASRAVALCKWLLP